MRERERQESYLRATHLHPNFITKLGLWGLDVLGLNSPFLDFIQFVLL